MVSLFHKRKRPSTIQKLHIRRSEAFGGIENARRAFSKMSQQERILFWLSLINS